MDPNAYNPNQGQGASGNPGQQPNPYAQNGYPQPQQPQGQPGYQPLQPLQPNPYSGYNPNAYPGEAETTPKKRGPGKLLFGVIAVIVIIAVAAAVFVAMSGNKSPATPQTPAAKPNTPDATADVIRRNDGQLDLSAKIDTTTSVKEQTIKAKTKEQINLSSGFSYMVTKIEVYTPADTTIKPGSGKQFVAVSVAVGNRAQANALSVSYLDFKLRANDNSFINGHASTQAILGNTLANPTSLKPGDQVTGKIVFEVDATDKDWVLVHKETYQKTTDNTTFTVEGDESVSLTPDTTTPPAASN